MHPAVLEDHCWRFQSPHLALGIREGSRKADFNEPSHLVPDPPGGARNLASAHDGSRPSIWSRSKPRTRSSASSGLMPPRAQKSSMGSGSGFGTLSDFASSRAISLAPSGLACQRASPSSTDPLPRRPRTSTSTAGPDVLHQRPVRDLRAERLGRPFGPCGRAPAPRRPIRDAVATGRASAAGPRAPVLLRSTPGTSRGRRTRTRGRHRRSRTAASCSGRWRPGSADNHQRRAAPP
jgi:hypothetical protein